MNNENFLISNLSRKIWILKKLGSFKKLNKSYHMKVIFLWNYWFLKMNRVKRNKNLRMKYIYKDHWKQCILLLRTNSLPVRFIKYKKKGLFIFYEVSEKTKF